MKPATWNWGQDPAALRRFLDDQGILAFPTESSYGLGVDPTSPSAVSRLNRLKNRPDDKPFGIVVASLDQAAGLGIDVDDPGVQAVEPHWPGALNVVAPLLRPLAAAGSGHDVSLRIPAHPQLVALLERLGPLTATSANLAGEPPITDPQDLANLLGDADRLIVIGGERLPGGEASTLVRWRPEGFVELRPGRFPFDRLIASTARNQHQAEST